MTRLQRIHFMLFITALLCITGCASTMENKLLSQKYTDVGIAYLKTGQYTQALKELIKAEKLTSNDPRIYYYLGSAYYGKGLQEKAQTSFEKALALKPDYSEAHNYLGTLFLETAQYDLAIKEFNLALSNTLYDTPEFALYNLGQAYYQKENYVEALNKYQKALNIEPNKMRPLIHLRAGITCFFLNDSDRAISHLKQSLDIMPTLAEARYWLGISYLQKGLLKSAVRELQNVKKDSPMSPFGMKAEKKLQSLGIID